MNDPIKKILQNISDIDDTAYKRIKEASLDTVAQRIVDNEIDLRLKPEICTNKYTDEDRFYIYFLATMLSMKADKYKLCGELSGYMLAMLIKLDRMDDAHTLVSNITNPDKGGFLYGTNFVYMALKGISLVETNPDKRTKLDEMLRICEEQTKTYSDRLVRDWKLMKKKEALNQFKFILGWLGLRFFELVLAAITAYIIITLWNLIAGH